MLDLLVTQRVHPGMEQRFEDLLRDVTASTLAKHQGCLRYEWYRAPEPTCPFHSNVIWRSDRRLGFAPSGTVRPRQC